MAFAYSYRSLLALTVLSILAFTLPGCGGTEAPEATTSATSSEAPAPAENTFAPAEEASAPPAIPDIEIPADDPVNPLQVSEEYSPTTASGGVEGVPAATNTVPIVAIANFYADLPGLDLSSLTPAQREKFLHRANSELCTCGCKNDTLAKCYMNDETCTTVRDILQKVLQEVRSGG